MSVKEHEVLYRDFPAGEELTMTKDVLHTIQASTPDLSKGQKRIAAYILSDYDKAAFMTASKGNRRCD